MSIENITPGNWTYDGKAIKTDYVKENKNEYGVARVDGWYYGDNFIADLNDGEYHEYLDPNEQDANGYLLSAAPNMYKCLSDICLKCKKKYPSTWNTMCHDCSIWKALSKAQGIRE